MAYQLFQRKSARVAEARWTIRGEKIALNEAAVNLIAQKGARWFHLLWDPEKRRMAIRPTTQDDDSYYLSLRGGQRGGVLSVGSFLKYIEWPSGAPVAVKPSWNNREQVLEVTLPQQTGSGSRAKVK
jgi:hypothetical protein